MKTLALFLLALSVSSLRADPPSPAPGQTSPAATSTDWTVNGKVYRNVVVGQIEADQVHITYDGGIGAFPLASLPAEIQKKLGYDPEKAATAAQIRALQAQITDLTEQNAELRAALSRYQGALSAAQTKAAITPKASIAAYHCFLYRTVVSLLYAGRVTSGPYAKMSEAEATSHAQEEWDALPDDQKRAYERMAEETGDPIVEREHQQANEPVVLQGQGGPPAAEPLAPATTTETDMQTGDTKVIVH
jgi:hypothetical protein